MTGSTIAIEDPRLKRLYGYWLSKKGDRKAPRRADILPEEITDILPWVFLMERVGHRLRYRLVGEEFRTIYGGKLIGTFMDEIDLDHVTAAYPPALLRRGHHRHVPMWRRRLRLRLREAVRSRSRGSAIQQTDVSQAAHPRPRAA
jgi:hypothetical protein